tara:strand:- start:261 stop:623 length:363 start_codon:yes stop_codon:yes gene_type:complete
MVKKREKGGTWTEEYRSLFDKRCRQEYGDRKYTATEMLAVIRAIDKDTKVSRPPRAQKKDSAPRSVAAAFNMVLMEALDGLEIMRTKPNLGYKWTKVQKQRYLDAFSAVANRIERLKRKT